MEMDIAIKRIRREMIEREKEEEKIHDRASFYEWYLQVAYTIAWENRGKILGAHNKRRIAQFDRSGKKIGEYNSIKIAANKCKLNRDVIDDSVSGKTKFTRKAGYYFRYI